MNTAVVITKTDPQVKMEAQKVARRLGLSLSSMINAYLKQVVRTKSIDFSLEEPGDYLVATIKRAMADRKRGKASPVFKDGAEAVRWLEKQGI